MTKQPLKALERKLGIRFTDPQLLAAATTHRSVGPDNYERLEFLGDGILNALIGAELFRICPKAPEGDLSRLRASLVRESTLAAIGRELSLFEFVEVGPGESGSHRRASVVADVLEAIIGAVFLDAGYEVTNNLVLNWFAQRLQDLPDAETLKDAKTRLQEYLQGREMPLPVYAVVGTSGPAHQRIFEVSCQLQGDSQEPIRARGSSRRRAEQVAAELMLDRLLNPLS